MRDGAVLPILHLNGYKIANPTVLACISEDELTHFFEGHGWTPYLVAGDDRCSSTSSWPRRLTGRSARSGSCNAWRRASRDGPSALADDRAAHSERVDGSAFVDGLPVEGTWRAHQVPLSEVRTNPDHLAMLDAWMRSYRPGEPFDDEGAAAVRHRLDAEGVRRMCANPHANGGVLLRDLDLPDFRDYAVDIERNGAPEAEATRASALPPRRVPCQRTVPELSLFGPDETASNRLDAVYEVTDKVWQGEILPWTSTCPHGRVMEILSEHTCEGWLEGYL